MEQLLSPLHKISKYLIAIPAAVFGVIHFMAAENMAPMVPVPGGVIWVYVTGAALIAAAVAIVINKKARLAATLLGVLVLIFVLTIHLPAVLKGGDAAQTAMSSLLKDLMISGGAFLLAGNFPKE